MFPRCKVWVLVFVGLMLICGQPAQAASRYVYAYFRTTPESTTMILLDPTGNVQTKNINVPEVLKSFGFYGSIASPTKEWIALPFHKYAEGTKLVLYNVVTGEFRDVAVGNFALRDISGTPDQHIVWSPDGKLIAFSVIASGNDNDLKAGVYLYSLIDGTLKIVLPDIQIFSRMAFSSDSRSLAISLRTCTDNQHCEFSIEIVDVGSHATQQHIALPYYDFAYESGIALDIVCSMEWSPNNRYLSFIPLCTRMPISVQREVYVWDTETGNLLIEMDFMADTPLNGNGIAIGLYSAHWLSSDTLLVGGVWGVIPDKIDTKTITVKVLEKTQTQFSTDAIEEIAINPAMNDVVYRSIPSVDANTFETSLGKLTLAELDSGIIRDTTSTKLGDGCNLNWSPDGKILAYFPSNGLGSYYPTCASPMTTIAFFDVNAGKIVEQPFIPSDENGYTSIVGWIPAN